MPGRARSAVSSRRHLAAMLLDDGAGAGMERPGAPVVAETLPCVQDVVFVGRGEGVEGRKAREEGREPGLDRRHRGLLQHELAEQDLVGRGSLTGSRPPGQLATVGVVPGEQPLDQPRRESPVPPGLFCSGHHVR